MTAPVNDIAPAAPQNLFGICNAVGEDFGFNPLWLRLAFAAVLILNPVAVIGAYFVLGAIVLSSRLVFPNRKPVAVVPVPAAMIAVRQSEPAEELPLAA